MASIWRVLLVYVAIRLNNTRARFDLVRLLPGQGTAAPLKVPKVKGVAGMGSASWTAELRETGYSLVRVEAVCHTVILGVAQGDGDGDGDGARRGEEGWWKGALRASDDGGGICKRSLLSWSIVTL